MTTKTKPKPLTWRLEEVAASIRRERRNETFSAANLAGTWTCMGLLRRVEGRVAAVKLSHSGPQFSAGPKSGWGPLSPGELPAEDSDSKAVTEFLQALRDVLEHGDPAKLDPAAIFKARRGIEVAIAERV